MSTDSGTPRTDAAVVSPAFIAREMDHYKHKFVLADICRDLEREAAALRADRDALALALRKIERGACLDQRIGDKCICYSCTAKHVLSIHGGAK